MTMKTFLKSFIYAFRGMGAAMRQRNLRVQIAVALVVICAGIYFDINRVEWCLLLLCIAMVMSLEIVNSALESMVDLVSPERKPLAGKIKDMAAGAVLLAAIVSA